MRFRRKEQETAHSNNHSSRIYEKFLYQIIYFTDNFLYPSDFFNMFNNF